MQMGLEGRKAEEWWPEEWRLGEGRGGQEGFTKGFQETSGDETDLWLIPVTALVSQACARVKTHQIVHFKYVQGV